MDIHNGQTSCTILWSELKIGKENEKLYI